MGRVITMLRVTCNTVLSFALSTRLFITSLGCASRRRGQRGGRAKRADAKENLVIPVITGNRRKPKPGANTQRLAVLTTVNTSEPITTTVKHDDKPSTPSLYVLNAAAIT